MTDKARELLERALSYTSCESWSPSLTEEIRNYLAEQKQYYALADRYVEGVTSGLEKCREYMDAQVWVAKELLSIREREVKREALSDEYLKIHIWRRSEDYGLGFVAGVRFAEKHHGIGGGDENPDA